MKWRTTLVVIAAAAASASAQSVLFNFDNAPNQTPLPIDLTVSGIQAHFTGTGQSFSIQSVGTVGIAPPGFSGLCIFPSSVYAADLLVSFSKTITDFSIMYSPQELGCDDSARMRVTAWKNGSVVGTNTTTAPVPGTWPSGTLTFSSASGFTSVVVHYDARPPTCQDYGVIFLADNMIVTPAPPPRCVADVDNGTFTGTPDGGVTIDDLLYYLFLFDRGLLAADVDNGTFTGTPDGGVTIDDLLYYLFRFDAGC